MTKAAKLLPETMSAAQMAKAEKLHHDAMALTEKAFLARMRGDQDAARKLFARAFTKEKEAALAFEFHLDFEPTRSVLLRSAATLAHDCEKDHEAERLIAMGLAGNPPEEIAEELRDLREELVSQKPSSASIESRKWRRMRELAEREDHRRNGTVDGWGGHQWSGPPGGKKVYGEGALLGRKKARRAK